MMVQPYHIRRPRRAGRWLVGSAIIGILVIAQLAYPRTWSLPLETINRQHYLFPSAAVLADSATDYNHQTIRLIIDGHQYTPTRQQIGITANPSSTAKRAATYPTGSRFIPLSFVWTGLQSHPVAYTVNTTALNQYVTQIVEQYTAAPKDAGVTVQGDKLAVVPGTPGQQYNVQTITQQLVKASQSPQPALTIKPILIQPDLTDQEVAHLIAPVQLKVDAGLTLTADTNHFTPDKTTIASWFKLHTDPTTHGATIDPDPAAVTAYLNTIKNQVAHPAGVTTINLTDGVESSRTTGESGESLDVNVGTQKVIQALNNNQKTADLSIITSPPSVTYTRAYSNSQQGLQALLDYLVSTKGDYGIAVRDLSSRGWSASSNGDKTYVAASTYKLFDAYSTLSRIDDGQFSWSDPTFDTDLSTCFDNMILYSDNDCAEALGQRIGWDTIISEVSALGLTNTSYSDTFYSTANDEALFLTKLAQGQILSSDSQNRLINRMEGQVYRTGIPAGVGSNITVADKVGFLWGYLNDAAIVYSPGRTYVLVILTNNSSWDQIADTAKQIQAQMAR